MRFDEPISKPRPLPRERAVRPGEYHLERSKPRKTLDERIGLVVGWALVIVACLLVLLVLGQMVWYVAQQLGLIFV